MEKTNIIAGSMLMLGVGMFTGNQISNHQAEAYRATFVQEIEGFTSDMEWDVKEGVIDSSAAAYYLHNFEVIHDQLTTIPEQYTEWYEQNSKNTTRCNSNRLDSVCNNSNNCSNYKLNTNEDG